MVAILYRLLASLYKTKEHTKWSTNHDPLTCKIVMTNNWGHSQNRDSQWDTEQLIKVLKRKSDILREISKRNKVGNLLHWKTKCSQTLTTYTGWLETIRLMRSMWWALLPCSELVDRWAERGRSEWSEHAPAAGSHLPAHSRTSTFRLRGRRTRNASASGVAVSWSLGGPRTDREKERAHRFDSHFIFEHKKNLVCVKALQN